MTRAPDDPSYGPVVLVDRPLGPWLAWTLMVGPVAAGSALMLPIWPLTLGLLVSLSIVSVLLFGDRLLIEQRLHERALVSRTLLPWRPVWMIPLFLVPPDEVRVTKRVNWEDADERVLPASAVLRSLPWGRVVRVPGPEPFAAKVRRGESTVSVPRDGFGASMLHVLGQSQRWAFSFRSPDDAARNIAELSRAERIRLDHDRWT